MRELLGVLVRIAVALEAIVVNTAPADNSGGETTPADNSGNETTT